MLFFLLLRYGSCVVDNSYRCISDSSANNLDSVADKASEDDLLEFFFTLFDNLLECSWIASDNDLLECSAFSEFFLLCGTFGMDANIGFWFCGSNPEVLIALGVLVISVYYYDNNNATRNNHISQ